jgi:D-xylose transport system permease protein
LKGNAVSDITVAATDFAGDQGSSTLAGALQDYRRRLKGGEIGSLPAIAGFIVLCMIFTIAKGDVFFSALNFANLIQQAAWMMILAMGITFVLLIGEIDLAAGAVMGVTSATIFTRVKADWPIPLAILVGVAIGVVLGLITGFLVAKVGIPSFVTTLALFLAFQGLTLKIAKEGGSIKVPDNSVLQALNARNMSPALSWAFFVIAIGLYAAYQYRVALHRRAQGVHTVPISLITLKVVSLGVIGLVLTFILTRNRALPSAIKPLRGIPWIVPVIIILLTVLTFALNRTRWGRHIYAVGGNAEAARRAGIDVQRIRMSAFVMSSTIAVVAGLAYSSKLGSVTPQTGAGDELLRAVGAAVVGGTSLFGGRGKMSYAIVGALVLAGIDNGLGLISSVGPFDVDAGFKAIITGAVLLVAGGVDALTRRRNSAAG